MLSSKKMRLAFVVCALVTIALVFTMTPMSDDFDSAAAPFINDGTWRRLLPTTGFWRPIEGMLGYFLGAYPFLFPWLNKSIVLAGHFFLCYALYRGLLWYTQNKNQAFVGAAVFALAPGVVATTSQIDGINQCWALVTGVLSLTAYFRGWLTGSRIYYVAYVVLALLAVLFKENGISWFLAPVFLHIIYRYQKDTVTLKQEVWQHRWHLLLGVVYSLGYFALRFAFMGRIDLGQADGRYAFHPTLGTLVKNFAIMHASAYTCIDSLAVFLKPHLWAVVGITALLTLLLYLAVVRSLYRYSSRKQLVVLAGLLMVNMYNSLGLAIMPHVSEMSAYQLTLGFAFITGLIWQFAPQEKILRCAMVLFLVGSLGVSLHKFAVMHVYAENTETTMEHYRHEFKRVPSKVLIFYVIADTPKQYSVFMQPTGEGVDLGVAYRRYWNWLDPHNNITVRQCKQRNNVELSADDRDEYDTIFVQYQDGRLEVLQN